MRDDRPEVPLVEIGFCVEACLPRVVRSEFLTISFVSIVSNDVYFFNVFSLYQTCRFKVLTFSVQVALDETAERTTFLGSVLACGVCDSGRIQGASQV